jgi:hypothetical protein
MIESLEIRVEMRADVQLEAGDTLILSLHTSEGVLGTRLISIKKRDGNHRSVDITKYKRDVVKA